MAAPSKKGARITCDEPPCRGVATSGPIAAAVQVVLDASMDNRGGARTSVDILNERNELRERVAELESAVLAIEREFEHALRFPEINFLTLCRIGTLTRRARPGLANARPRVLLEEVGT
jgi:hypothetical protein